MTNASGKYITTCANQQIVFVVYVLKDDHVN